MFRFSALRGQEDRRDFVGRPLPAEIVPLAMVDAERPDAADVLLRLDPPGRDGEAKSVAEPPSHHVSTSGSVTTVRISLV